MVFTVPLSKHVPATAVKPLEMGHPSLTVFLQFAMSRALTIYTTTRLRSPADLGCVPFRHLTVLIFDKSKSGGFDIPNEKCPPDGGSSGCVTGSPASSFFSSSPHSTSERARNFNPNNHAHFAYPLTPESTDSEFTSSLESLALPSAGTTIPIPTSKSSARLPAHNLLTPPYTPDEVEGGNSFGNISARQSSAALDFLTTLFPRSCLTALPHAKSVTITSPALEAVWEGIILNLPSGQPTLYVNGKGAEHVKLRER